MAQKCTICSHAQRRELEQRLISNEPLRAVARQCGVSRSALSRHRAAHMARERTLFDATDAAANWLAARELVSELWPIVSQLSSLVGVGVPADSDTVVLLRLLAVRVELEAVLAPWPQAAAAADAVLDRLVIRIRIPSE